jgi:hypothetical protein
VIRFVRISNAGVTANVTGDEACLAESERNELSERAG